MTGIVLHSGLSTKIYDKARNAVATIPMPPFWEPPRVIVWQGRYFALSVDGDYRETPAYIVPEEKA